jgi:hypothetical protein
MNAQQIIATLRTTKAANFEIFGKKVIVTETINTEENA